MHIHLINIGIALPLLRALTDCRYSVSGAFILITMRLAAALLPLHRWRSRAERLEMICIKMPKLSRGGAEIQTQAVKFLDALSDFCVMPCSIKTYHFLLWFPSSQANKLPHMCISAECAHSVTQHPIDPLPLLGTYSEMVGPSPPLVWELLCFPKVGKVTQQQQQQILLWVKCPRDHGHHLPTAIPLLSCSLCFCWSIAPSFSWLCLPPFSHTWNRLFFAVSAVRPHWTCSWAGTNPAGREHTTYIRAVSICAYEHTVPEPCNSI